MDSEETQRRMEQLEREIAELKAASTGGESRIGQLEQELKAIQPEPEKHPSWQRVQLARHPKRPHSLDYIQRLFTDFHEIHGDRGFADDAAIVCGWAFFEDRPVMVVGQQKGRDTKQKLFRNFGMPKPEGYRKALRVMRMAAKFGRPVITLLDTPGAYPGIDAEERGQAEAIALNLREMARLATPDRGGRDRRRRLRRRARPGRRQPRLDAGERHLQRDLAGKLRRHHLSRLGQGRTGRGGAEVDRAGSAPPGPDRRDRARAARRRPGGLGPGRRVASPATAEDFG